MYSFLLSFHNLFRWLVVFSLLYAIYMAYEGKSRKRSLTKMANLVRHWTATIAHIELMIGIVLYTQSPTVRYFLKTGIDGWNDGVFFGLVHVLLMFTAIVLITVGSAKAKRASDDLNTYRIIFNYYLMSLVIIFIAIPWPFSPFAQRPFLRLL